jgi:outer membrane protein assembly factor BamB
LLLLPLLGALGCATAEWEAEEAVDVVRTDLLMSPEAALAVGYRINWATDLAVPPSERIRAIALLDDLIVLVETPSNRVTAVRFRDGQTAWTRILGDASTRLFRPMRRDEKLYVASPTRLYTLSARNGDLLHVDNFETTLAADPILVEGYAICGGMTGELFAHDLTSGYGKWSYDLTARIRAEPQAAGFNIFAADSNGVYAMVTANDGTKLWRGRTFGPITAPAAIDQLAVYLPSNDQTLYALDRSTGREKWKLPLEQPLIASPTSIGLSLYLPLEGRGTVAIDAIDGSVRWEDPATAEPVLGDDQRLLLASGTGIQIRDSASGALIAHGTTLPVQTVLSGPEEALVLVSSAGRLLRLNRLK